MRTLPTNYQYTQLYQNGIIAHYAQVLVYNATGTTSIDVTNYDGMDFLRQVTISDSVDDPGLTAKITLQQAVYKKSFSPQNTYSKYNQGSPAIFVGRRVLVYMGSVPVDVAPQSSDMMLVADLTVDSMEFGKDTIELSCSDRIVHLLKNAYIDTQKPYGVAGFTNSIEVIMQSVIDDNINTPLGYTVINGKKIQMLLPGGSPSFLMAPQTVNKSSVLDALNQLAGNIGWSMRVKWAASMTAFALCFYAPPRGVAGSPVFSFSPYIIDDISQATISKSDIRNYIYGYFSDSANNNVRQLVIAQDAASIAKYGDPPMKMEITEAATSQINTLAQMNTLLGNALTDLKDPVCQYALQVPLFYVAETGDTYTLLPDGTIFDVSQVVGLCALTHTVGKNACNTQMTVKGAIPGQYNRWFYAEARPGISPSANMIDPAAPAVSLGSNIGEIVVNYTVADQNNWSSTEIYLSSTSGALTQSQTNSKYQRPTGGSLAAKGKVAHFLISALTPGATYYVGIVVIDRDGNIGAMSAVQAVTTQMVGPYQTNPAGQQDQLLKNPDFNIYTLGTGFPPDNWAMQPANSWSAGFVNNTQGASGGLCLGFTIGVPQMQSTLFPFPENELMAVGVFAKATSTSSQLYLQVFYYSAPGTQVGSVSKTFSLTTAYQSYSLPTQVTPAGTKFAAVNLSFNNVSGTCYLDRAYVSRAKSYYSFNPVNGVSKTWSAGSNIQLQLGVVGNIGVAIMTPTTSTTYAQITLGGTYYLQASVHAVNGVANTNNVVYLRIDVSTDGGSTWTTVASSGNTYNNGTWQLATQAGPVEMAAGDRIRYVIGGSSGGTITNTDDNGVNVGNSNYCRLFCIQRPEQ